MSESETDPEMFALETVARALAPLAASERHRILDWCKRKWLTPEELVAEVAEPRPADRERALVASGLIDKAGRYLGRRP
jgi:hypothetical protein